MCIQVINNKLDLVIVFPFVVDLEVSRYGNPAIVAP